MKFIAALILVQLAFSVSSQVDLEIHNSNPQPITVPLLDDSKIRMDPSSGNIRVFAKDNTSTVNSLIGGGGSSGGIDYFNGPCGSDNCNVSQNTSFSMFWGVTDVGGCVGSNSANNIYFNGNVEPLGGGSGEYSKSIIGGLPVGTYTFNLDCPSAQAVNINIKKVLARDVMLMKAPPSFRGVYMYQGYLLMDYTLVKDNTMKTNTPVMKNGAFTPIGSWHGTISYQSEKDLPININVDNSSSYTSLPANQVRWLVISEEDPDSFPGGVLKHGYDIGRCDTIGRNPRLDFSTHEIIKSEKGNVFNDNILHTCVIEPNKQYYLTTYYLELE